MVPGFPGVPGFTAGSPIVIRDSLTVATREEAKFGIKMGSYGPNPTLTALATVNEEATYHLAQAGVGAVGDVFYKIHLRIYAAE